MSRHTDAELMREIHAAWQEFGCALCGYVAYVGAAEGWGVEVHHIVPRSQGGPDSWENTIGLCGELVPQKCHWKVTTNQIKLAVVDEVGLVWTDTRSGEEGICRELSEESSDIRRLVGGAKPLAEAPIPSKKLPVPSEWVPDLVKLKAEGEAGAVERFQVCQALIRRAERDLLTLAILVQEVASTKEWALLGYESIGDYADAAGISAPTLSKLRFVGKTFLGEWESLPEADRTDLSLDRLYYAGQLLKLGAYPDSRFALSEAVAKPQRYLYQELKDARHGDAVMHECPDCGASHWIKPEKKVEA